MEKPDLNVRLAKFTNIILAAEKEHPLTYKDKLFSLFSDSFLDYIFTNFRKSEYLQNSSVLDDLIDCLDMDYESSFIRIVSTHLNFILEIGIEWGIKKLADHILEVTGNITSLEELQIKVSELSEEQAEQIITMYNNSNRASLI